MFPNHFVCINTIPIRIIVLLVVLFISGTFFPTRGFSMGSTSASLDRSSAILFVNPSSSSSSPPSAFSNEFDATALAKLSSVSSASKLKGVTAVRFDSSLSSDLLLCSPLHQYIPWLLPPPAFLWFVLAHH